VGSAQREFQYAAVDLSAKYHRQLGVDSLPRLLAAWCQRHPWRSTRWKGWPGRWATSCRARALGKPMCSAEWMPAWGHPSRWVRRVAMLHQLGWRAETDRGAPASLRAGLGAIHEIFICKAMSWALRGDARTQPEAVRAFLAEHAHALSRLDATGGGQTSGLRDDASKGQANAPASGGLPRVLRGGGCSSAPLRNGAAKMLPEPEGERAGRGKPKQFGHFRQ